MVFTSCHKRYTVSLESIANASGYLVQPDTFESRQIGLNIPDFPGRPDLQSFFNHPFRLFDYGPDSGPMNGEYYMPLGFGGKLVFDDVSGKSTAGDAVHP
jgi:hypothetical protein